MRPCYRGHMANEPTIDEKTVIVVVARSALSNLRNAYDLLCLLTDARKDLLPVLPLVHQAIEKLAERADLR